MFKVFMYSPTNQLQMFVGFEPNTDNAEHQDIYVYAIDREARPDKRLVALRVGTLFCGRQGYWQDLDSEARLGRDFHLAMFNLIDFRTWRAEDRNNPLRMEDLG